MFMNTVQEIPDDKLHDFKLKVKIWLDNDQLITEHESKIRNLKKNNKDIEPEITAFMRQYNISDLNTSVGKIKCNARNVKKPLNKHNIRSNLSMVIADSNKLDEAMTHILTNRDIITTYRLIKPKMKLSIQ